MRLIGSKLPRKSLRVTICVYAHISAYSCVLTFGIAQSIGPIGILKAAGRTPGLSAMIKGSCQPCFIYVGSPVVPFCPFSFEVSLMKPKSRKKQRKIPASLNGKLWTHAYMAISNPIYLNLGVAIV